MSDEIYEMTHEECMNAKICIVKSPETPIGGRLHMSSHIIDMLGPCTALGLYSYLASTNAKDITIQNLLDAKLHREDENELREAIDKLEKCSLITLNEDKITVVQDAKNFFHTA